MPSLRNSLNIRSRVMWVRAFFNTYKRRVIAAGGVIQNEPCAVRSLNNNLLRSASWVLVPSGIEEDIVFAQKPTSGLGDLTFTRASDATYTDSAGVVRRSPYNLLTFSEMFSDASWTKGNTTIGVNTTTAPNGTLTADSLIEDTTNSQHTITKSFAAVNGSSYTQSWYVKPNGRTQVQLEFSFGAKPVFNLVGNGSATLGGVIQNVGNGWYRISWTATSSATASLNSVLKLVNAGNITYTGNGTSGVFLWGAQLVEGSSALDYFPTTDRQNVPRIDFRNADGTLSGCGRLLLEPQRTNLLLRSEEFDNAAWGKFTTTVVANAEISPDGTQDAETMTVSTTDSRVEQTTTLTAGTYIFSVYVKVISQTTAGTMRLQSFVDGANVNLNFTPTTQWQRVTATYTAASSLTSVKVRGQAFVGTLAIWGAQLEAGAYATSYIPTTTAAVTRLADAASKTGVSSLIGQTEGTVFLDLNYQAITGLSMFLSIRPNATNKIEVYRDGTTIFGDIVGNSVSVILSRVANPAGQYKIALAYKSGQTALYINGASVGTSSTAFSFATSMADLFLNLRSGPTFVEQTFYNQAALFPTRLDNATLAQLTTL